MWIDSGHHDVNREVFDAIYAHREAFEAAFDDEVTWDRRDDRRACTIAISRPGSITDDEDRLAAHMEWMISTQERFRSALDRVGLPDSLRG